MIEWAMIDENNFVVNISVGDEDVVPALEELTGLRFLPATPPIGWMNAFIGTVWDGTNFVLPSGSAQ